MNEELWNSTVKKNSKFKIQNIAHLVRKCFFIVVCFFLQPCIHAQVKWTNVDADFQPLPENFHVYKTTDSLHGRPFIAYYAEAALKDKHLVFTADTTRDRRITPKQFYEKDDHPLLVVNTSFFSYETNRSLNVVIRKGKMVCYNNHTIPMKGKDTFQYRHPFTGAIGIDKKRKADVAWLFTDSAAKYPYALQASYPASKDSVRTFSFETADLNTAIVEGGYSGKHGASFSMLKKWKMRTAVGGGPVLVQRGEVNISNNDELKFGGKAIDDKHPRTCMGYTKDGRLIVLVIQGRYKGIAEGADLKEEAQLLKDIGCEEALNLDGGGSSCMLINGKETIKPSEKGEERPVPAVFIIKAASH